MSRLRASSPWACCRRKKGKSRQDSPRNLVEAASHSIDAATERWLCLVGVLLFCGCLYYAITDNGQPAPKQRMTSIPKRRQEIRGVAAMCCFDGPEWMQRRYTAIIANARQAIPNDWGIQIFHKDDSSYERGLRVNPGLSRSKNIFWTPLELKRKKRADLILSIELWMKLIADTVLFFSSGGAFCLNGPSLETFLDFRFLAASNGGLLLANRFDVLQIINAERQIDADVYFLQDKHNPLAYLEKRLKDTFLSSSSHDSATLQNIEKEKIKDRRPQLRFAAADAYNLTMLGLPFAITSTLARLHSDDRNMLLELCPESKMIFPALHHPACFGASSTLDKERCFASLCVSNPKKGGC